MDLRRFLDLFISESQEHVSLLHRSVLALEHDPAAVDEAFRAAHTLKGLAAAMGYGTVADLAHRLEDRLEEVRAGRLLATAGLIDTLLAGADELEAAVAVAARTPPSQGLAGAASGVTPAAATGSLAVGEPLDIPAGTHRVARIRLHPDAPIKAARAMLIVRSLAEHEGMLGSAPAEFADDFGGDFSVFFGAAADLAAAESTIRAGGEVTAVEFLDPARAQPAAPKPVASLDGPAAGQRQIRVDSRRLDGIAEGIGELSVLYGRVGPDDAVPVGVADLLARMGTVVTSLQHEVLALRMVPVREAFERLPRVVRDASRTLEKEVELIVEGDDVELDRAILSEIGEPLVHLLRNAVDHGIETTAQRAAAGKSPKGQIRVSAERERSSVRIVVADDGRGVAADRVVARAKAAGLLPPDAAEVLTDEELFRLLSHAGLSTADQVSAVSGRGVGMDVVVSRIRALGGAIEMHTQPGAGTTFHIRLPITLALALALRVRIAGEEYAIPLTHVAEAVELHGDAVSVNGREVLRLRDEQLPLVRMRRKLGAAHDGGVEQAAVIAEMGDRRAALAVDELIGREQILVKSFDPVTGMLPYFSGATILADGRPALVLDPLSVI